MGEVGLGIVQKGNLFLLIERAKKEGDLIWAFPGGKMESLDSCIEDTIIREIEEETGILCSTSKNLGYREIGDNTIHYYLCNYESGEINIDSKEVLDAGWFTVNEIYDRVTSNIFEPVKLYLDDYKS